MVRKEPARVWLQLFLSLSSSSTGKSAPCTKHASAQGRQGGPSEPTSAAGARPGVPFTFGGEEKKAAIGGAEAESHPSDSVNFANEMQGRLTPCWSGPHLKQLPRLKLSRGLPGRAGG